MVLEFIHILLPYFFIAHHIMIKTFSSLDMTKHIVRKGPYFVTEVIFGQKCINLLQQNAYN